VVEDGGAVFGTDRETRDFLSSRNHQASHTPKEGHEMNPGIYMTKDGEIVTVSLTVNGRYMITYPDGRRTFV